MKKVLLIVGFIIMVSMAAGGCYFWKSYQNYMNVNAVEIDPLFTVYLGSGNSVVLTSPDKQTALIVDTKMRGAAESLRQNVKAKNITIVNTHVHLDHLGGNSLYPEATIIAGEYSRDMWNEESGGASRYPDIVLKPGEEEVLRIGDETVHIVNVGQAHTFSDVVVYMERRKLLVVGDLAVNNMHPPLVAKSGTDVPLWIETLNALSEKYVIKTLVPGHGDIAGRQLLADMRAYFIAVQNALGNETKIATLKEKFKDYESVPFAFSINDTLNFIEQQQKARKELAELSESGE